MASTSTIAKEQPKFSADWLRQRLARAHKLQPQVEFDATDALDARELLDVTTDWTPAAVLVPVIRHDDGLTLLFTQRTAHLTDHPGQVSFPGGRCEVQDESFIFTALREAQEEIGLEPACVEVIGRLPEFHTITGFRVVPVVGLIHPPLQLRLDEFEVAEVFETPLDFLLNPENHQRHSREYDGVLRQYYAMSHEGRYIWGATAGMIVSLYRALLSEVSADTLKDVESAHGSRPA